MKKALLLLASLGIVVLLASGVASAALTNLADEGTANFNGQVRTILEVGNRVYIGGDFTQVNGIPRNYLAAVDATTGELTEWNPNANGSVRTLAASPDGSRIYTGGAFTSIGGTYRGRLAAINATTGTLDTAWYPGTANNTVRAIAVSGNRVYLGGDFTTVRSESRTRLALVDSASGALDPNWVPTADSTVRTLDLSADGSRLYAGGDFGYISGRSRPNLAAIDASTGVLDTAFIPTTPNGLIYALTASGGRVYTAEGGLGGAVAAYDATTGIRAWSRSADGDVQGVAVLNSTVYAAGHFDSVSGQSRRVFAAVDASTGVLDSQWTPTADPGYPGVWVLRSDVLRKRLYAGGDFVRVSGQPHERFAQFTDSGTSVDINAPETIINSGPTGTVSNTSASFEFSSTELGSTFECSLDGVSFSRCTSPQSYAGLSNGSHTFRVRATDAAGNTDATPASRTWKVQVSGKTK